MAVIRTSLKVDQMSGKGNHYHHFYSYFSLMICTSHFSATRLRNFHLKKFKCFLLLFADDTVLFSYSKEGLQCLINKLSTYCNTWGVKVNIDKTVAMVFKKGNRPENVEFVYENSILKLVKIFYLSWYDIIIKWQLRTGTEDIIQASIESTFFSLCAFW